MPFVDVPLDPSMTPNASSASDAKSAPIANDDTPLTPPFSKHVELIPTSDTLCITHRPGPPEIVQVTAGAEENEYYGVSNHGRENSPNGLGILGRQGASPRPPSTTRIDTTVRSPTSPKQPVDILDSLPTIAYDANKQVFEVRSQINDFLVQDLDTSRLNAIHGILWMAGRPLNARQLHRYVMLDIRILRTEQTDMHVLRVSNRMFVKPLPAYLLSYDFWKKYLCGPPTGQSEDDRALHKRACGLLMSYVWLIRSELDMKIAKDEHLVPKDVNWHWWKAFVADLLADGHLDANSLKQCDMRYHYGELRLSRINTIYRIRFFHTHFIRGYLYGYNRYVVFFQRNFGWMLVIFVYFSLVLSAMQVGVSVPPLQDNVAFQRASYGFVVFSIVLVAAIVGIIGLLFVAIFAINTILSIRHSLLQSRERRKLAKAKKGEKHA
ncbi:hypothetical protein EJ05DRAFT_496144 [Pseudovirgaria hyperparasitica]|uniref:Uncharacterized protein n=1 Tax=Pseudovirgaria hyperparasitica TaxID=470096 RepID=A0A6A6WM73_9PEZI|nr:uncharacterized protein EJ05DRAFT_496144 [Pseudovirgaria hyperparasitica]KAF2763317.1 hypothetical protein EJ05DRAFT_496144 [Pseudovirgaria hyperparasitica]